MELRPLATLELALAGDGIFLLGKTPEGNRMIAEIGSAQLVGDRIAATLKGRAAADWAAVGDDGRAVFDIRMLLETADGALVYLSYLGKSDWSGGAGSKPIHAVAEFETADERYAWLNTATVVGKGALTDDRMGVRYEFYELD